MGPARRAATIGGQTPSDTSPEHHDCTMIRCAMIVSLVVCCASFGADTLRVATFNVWDVSSRDLAEPDQPRIERIVGVLQAMRPDIVLINELAYDGVPGNAGRLADLVRRSQGPGLEPLDYSVFTAPSNTGLTSGLDPGQLR